MGFWAFTFLVAVIIGYFRLKKLNDKYSEIEKELQSLKKDVSSLLSLYRDFLQPDDQLKADAATVKEETKPAEKKSPEIGQKVIIPPAPVIPPEPNIPPPLSIPPHSDIPSSGALESEDAEKPEIQAGEEKEEESLLEQIPEPPYDSRLAWKPKWEEFKKNVDWEQFTGVKLFAWLGGLALFIGAVFFVKYSIDNNLIPAQVRLAVGAITGLAMIVYSLRIDREQYVTTAHSLAAGGIAVLYAVSYAATVYYGFIPKTAGFGLFSLISAAAFVLSVFHKGKFISVLGAVGAYATPLLIRTGHPSLFNLFIYLTVVNIGVFEVIRMMRWLPLILLVAAGTLFTLSAGAWGTFPPAENYLICAVAIANLMVFSLFFHRRRGQEARNRSIIISMRMIFISMPAVALTMFNDPGWLPLMIITAATSAALVLSYEEKSWGAEAVFYTFGGFILALFWVLINFDLREPSWGMIIFLVYGLTAGLGPVFIIKKNGIDTNTLRWLKIFPAALAAVAVAAFMRTHTATILFWPMLLGINIIGTFISLIVGSIVSLVVLILILLGAGIYWILQTPALQIGNGFYLTVLFSGLLLCFVTVLFLKKLRTWNPLAGLEELKGFIPASFTMSSNWISALPVLSPFLLLALVLFRQQPLAPNPAMATGLCFFAISVFLARRVISQEILAVSIAALASTEISWGMRVAGGDSMSLTLLGWSAFLWLAALILPHLISRPEKDWKTGWHAWAVFELVQALFIFRTATGLWGNTIAGLFPLALAVLKLPAAAVLIKRLTGKDERNAILAFHGGVLLFYVSSIAVLLLGNAWLGMTFVVEATLLLWLNRRIEHPGLRWVSLLMAPAGLMLLLANLNTLKTAQDLPVLNPAVLSVAACVTALGIAVKLSGFPKKELTANISLPEYFLWFSTGAGFFLLNFIVADIFGRTGGGFRFSLDNNINQSVSYSILWTVFGAVILRINALPKGFKIAGAILVALGWAGALWMPIRFGKEIAVMPPFINLGLINFIPVIAVISYLARKQENNDFGGERMKELYIILGLVIGLMAITVEMSTVFQSGIPFKLFAKPLPGMALALIVSWFVYGYSLLLWPCLLDNRFRSAGLILMVISIARAGFFPLYYAVDFGAMKPFINIPTLVFMLIIVGLTLLTVKKFKYELIWKQEESPRYLYGILLILFSFYVMNVEVASYFGMFNTDTYSGSFTFHTHGRLSQQLAYSLSWLLFALVLLAIGIRWKIMHIRWVALGLIVITSLKVFLKDLWALGQLYRVFSFIGLAVTLMFVSFLYQRYFIIRKINGEEN